MQRKLIIPFVVFILLVFACFFRWEQGPTQTEKDLKIVHLRDRWTGQAWVSKYGSSGGKFYSGELEPIPLQQKIEKRKLEILVSTETIQQKQDLEEKINKYEKERNLHVAGYNEYQRMIKLNKSQRFNFTGLSNLEILATIPKHIIDEYIAWNNANKILYQTIKELENQPKQAEIQAESELKTWAWQERKIYTYAWGVVLTIFIITTIFIFKGFKVKQSSDIKYE